MRSRSRDHHPGERRRVATLHGVQKRPDLIAARLVERAGQFTGDLAEPPLTADGRASMAAAIAAEHGATVHPDDEDHRSARVALTVRARRAEARGPGEETELELGVLRRAGESETWIVIETGIGASLALTRDGARLLLRRLGDLIAPGGILGRDGDER